MIDLMRVGVTLWLVDRVMPGLGMLTRGMRDFGRATESTQLQLRAMEASIMRTQGRALGLMYPGTAAQRKEMQAQMLLQDASMKQQKMAMVQQHEAAQAAEAQRRKSGMIGAAEIAGGFMIEKEMVTGIKLAMNYDMALRRIRETSFGVAANSSAANQAMQNLGATMDEISHATMFSLRNIAEFMGQLTSQGLKFGTAQGILPAISAGAEILYQFKQQDPGATVDALGAFAQQMLAAKGMTQAKMIPILNMVTQAAEQTPGTLPELLTSARYMIPVTQQMLGMDPLQQIALLTMITRLQGAGGTRGLLSGRNVEQFFAKFRTTKHPELLKAWGLGDWAAHPDMAQLMTSLATAEQRPQFMQEAQKIWGGTQGAMVAMMLGKEKAVYDTSIADILKMGTVTEQQTRLMSETQDKLARLGTDIENVRLRFSHGLVPALGGAADKLDEWTYKLLQAEQHHPVATARAGWGTTGLGLGMMGLGGLRVADWLLGSGMHPWLMKTTGSALATAFAGIGGLPVWGTIGIAIAAGFLLYWADKKYGAEIGNGID